MTDNRFDGTPLAQNGPIFTPQSDFSFGYQPINGNYPAGTPGSYSVGVNDTLQTIAKGAYGDSSLWYLIADANGLSSNADLRAGQVLRIPAATSGANNVNTFKPYDPSKIANDSATMMAMPQDKAGGCGAVGQIIMVVVAVVAAAFGQPYIAAAMQGVMGASAATTALSYAATAAVSSIASQAVGIAIGAQDNFSWKQVGLAAISAGVTYGLSDVTFVPGSGSLVDIGNSMIRQAVGNALTQGIAVATGLQNKFDWKGVAASAAGAGVASGVGMALGNVNAFASFGSFGQELATRTTMSFAGGLTAAAMRGGRVSVTQVATDAFGNALGDSIAAANGQASEMTRGEAEERAAAREVYAMGDGIPRVNGLDFSQDAAARRAGMNPAGLPTYVGSDDPAFAYDYRNGSDIASDNYNGSRRTATVRNGQGPLAALADLGLNSAQQQAGYGYLLKTGQVQVGRNGVPMVQPGQELHIDLDDMSNTRLAGRAITRENSMRADRLADAAQAATDSYANAETRRFANPPPSLMGSATADLAYGAGGGRGFINPASAGLSTAERAGLIALGGKDAVMGAVEAAGYSYGVVGTPESRAAWAIQTVDAGIAGMRKFFSDPKGAASGWWGDLNSNDPQAVRDASAVGSGVALGVGGGIVAGRLMALGRPMSFSGAGLTKYDLASEAAYADIRALRMTDIESFAKNTGLTVGDATTLKKQLFFGRHEYPVDGSTIVRQRFAADHEIAYAWKTATEGELNPGQQAWIRQLADHELGERSFMAQGIPYLRQEAWNGSSFGTVPPGAHNLAPKPPNTTFPGYQVPSSFWSY